MRHRVLIADDGKTPGPTGVAGFDMGLEVAEAVVLQGRA
jgi:hypothetical protein